MIYYVFDLLQPRRLLDHRLPLIWRKRLLRRAVQFDDPLRFTTHRAKEGEAAYPAACKRGDEGVIAKTGRCTLRRRRSHC